MVYSLAAPAAHDEIEQSKLIREETKVRHADNLKAISQSMKKSEQTHKEEILQLQRENHNSLNHLSKCQNELHVMQTQILQKQAEKKKIQSSLTIGAIISCLLRHHFVSIDKIRSYRSILN